MKCPFCQQELERNDLDVQLFGCENQNCKHSTHYDAVGTKELWQELVSKCNQLENLMKAVDLSIEAINKGCDALIGCQEADDKYISDITAEDGLELLSEYLGKIRFLINEAKDGKLGN